MKRLHNAFPQPPKFFSNSVANTLEKLEKKEIIMKEKQRKFAPLKLAAAAVAATIALTVGVGAATDWNYRGAFSTIFGGGDIGDLGISQMPNVSNMKSSTDKIDLEVLGIAGDDQLIHMLVKLTPKNGYEIDVFDYSLTMATFKPVKGTLGAAGWGGGGLNLVEQLDDGSVIASTTINFSRYGEDGVFGGWTKGNASMELVKLDFSEKGNYNNYNKVMTFDVLIDYDFNALKTIEVGENVDFGYGDVFLRSIDITPINVRYTVEMKMGSIPDRRTEFSVVTSVTLASGEVLESDGIGGGGGFYDESGAGFMSYGMSFEVPFDINEVVAVTINGIVFEV